MENKMKKYAFDVKDIIPNCYEDVLYHYTTLDSLLSIVKNKTLRLTDYRFLNDKSEIIENIKLMQDFVKYGDFKLPFDDTYDKIDEDLMRILERKRLYIVREEDGNNDKWICLEQENVNHYILSLTYLADNLSMWSMYGKTGCRIKLNKEKLLNFIHSFEEVPIPNIENFFGKFNRDKNNIFNGDVQYSPLTIKICKPIFEDIIEKQKKKEYMYYGYDMLYPLACFYKCGDFETEREYRISIPIADEDIENNVFMEKTFLIKDDYFKPQLELKNFPVEEIIEDIILSPYNTSDCSVNSVKVLLSHYLKKDIEVQRSKINIRK